MCAIIKRLFQFFSGNVLASIVLALRFCLLSLTYGVVTRELDGTTLGISLYYNFALGYNY